MGFDLWWAGLAVAAAVLTAAVIEWRRGDRRDATLLLALGSGGGTASLFGWLA
ncbi:hypothetical protein [Ideonella paludis]|uniref:Uncharacterized protein n=1 Tax=Ideonella paludis TaxID=1233411 RepID=A0ABS5DT03_9BURK|nr:hypothetical protein [Ideonella paludis]MBQ0934230.1 hypothetical protein [Ideonella paludis]